MLRFGGETWRVPGLLGALFLACFPGVLRAQSIAGDYRPSATRIAVEVSEWGGDCGPRPTSTSAPGGGVVRVTQEGDHLSFSGRGTRNTRSCWSENRAVRLVSSSAASGTWRIICRTPAEDPRQETGTYTLRGVGNRIEYEDFSQYDWTLNESHCRATIRSTQSFERVDASVTAPEPTQTETAVETPRPAACTPGAPVRIVTRPQTLRVAPSDRICFHARVEDQNGCAVRSATVAATVDGMGTVNGQCYQATGVVGEAAVVLTSGAVTARVRVLVKQLDFSDILAQRAEGGSFGALPESESVAGSASHAEARTVRTSSWTLWAFPALALLVGVVVAFALYRRANKKRDEERRQVEEEREMKREIARAEREARRAKEKAAAAVVHEAKICPICRVGYTQGETMCAKDGTSLVLYKDFQGSAPAKVCPTCGERYEGAKQFCGKDGATLIEG